METKRSNMNIWIVFDFTRELLEIHVFTIIKQWMSKIIVDYRVFTGTSSVLWYSSSGMRPCVGRREIPDRSIGVISTTIPMQGTSSGRNTAATRKTSTQWFSIYTITVSIISFKVKYKLIFFLIQYFPEIKEVKLFYTHTIFRHKIT